LTKVDRRTGEGTDRTRGKSGPCGASASRLLPCLILLALAACSSQRESVPASTTATAPATAPAVTRRPLPEPAPSQGAASPAAPTPMPALVFPPGALYVCVAGPVAAPVPTAIEYSEKIDLLCRKHPEMGPCQYERNACRKKGGRVFAADGTEITLATEAEYDKKVRRVTFKSN